MKVPLKYNLRSLWIRRVGTAMTAVGVGLTVAIIITMMALVNGLDSTFVETGHEDHLVVIRKGSLNETNSYFNRDLFGTVRFLPGVALGEDQQPLAAGEIVVVINHPRRTGDPTNLLIRGTSELGFELRPEIQFVQGRMFRQGVREIVVSRSMSERFQDLGLGETLRVARNDWTVVGIFESGGSAYESEVFADYDEIAEVWSRPIYSSVLLKVRDQEAAQAIKKRVEGDNRIQLQALDQREYYKQQTVTSVGIKALGVFIAVVMGIGSCFAAMNIMYGAVMSRAKEVGTLRALGFRRRSILASFLAESVILAVLGGVVGCLLALPIHGISTGTSNFMTFSEVLFNFRITPQILLMGMLFATGVGIFGGFLPAHQAARSKLIDILRD